MRTNPQRNFLVAVMMQLMPTHRRIFLAGCGASLSLAQASTIIDPADDPLVTAQMYRDEAALYPMVGKVTGSGFNGSGVLIAERWVLTAGHVSYGKTSGTFQLGGTSYTIQSSVTHPSYSLASNSFDLGLLYLSAPVTAVDAARTVLLESSILGREATWVGNGFTGTGLTGQYPSFELRGFTNFIDVMGPEYGQAETSFVADFDRPDGSTNAPSSAPVVTRLEGNLATGDSGGGVFITAADGQRYLVGINSYTGRFGPGAASSYGSISGATNLDLFHSWIFAQTGITPVPEPGVWWLCTLGCLLSLRRRR
jgi:secreted trypsin-like serine protease